MLARRNHMAAGDALLLEHELAAPIAQIPGEACGQHEQNGDDTAAADGGGEDRRAELGVPRHFIALRTRPSPVRNGRCSRRRQGEVAAQQLLGSLSGVAVQPKTTQEPIMMKQIAIVIGNQIRAKTFSRMVATGKSPGSAIVPHSRAMDHHL